VGGREGVGWGVAGGRAGVGRGAEADLQGKGLVNIA
jgi:hypothetical protein